MLHCYTEVASREDSLELNLFFDSNPLIWVVSLNSGPFLGPQNTTAPEGKGPERGTNVENYTSAAKSLCQAAKINQVVDMLEASAQDGALFSFFDLSPP